MESLMLVGATLKGFCSDASPVLIWVGWILTIFKIAIPFLIIGYGMFDLGKAVVASKDDEIKKAANSLLKRAIAGIAIFFVPTIVMWVFGGVATYNSDQNVIDDYEICKNCILHPGNCDVGDIVAD